MNFKKIIILFISSVFTLIGYSQDSKISSEQCDKKFKHLEFLNSNKLISVSAYKEEFDKLNSQCDKVYIASEISFKRDSTSVNQQIKVEEYLNKLYVENKDAKNLIISGSVIAGVGGITYFALTESQNKTEVNLNPYRYFSIGVATLGGVLALSGIGLNMDYVIRRDKLNLSIGLMNGNLANLKLRW